MKNFEPKLAVLLPVYLKDNLEYFKAAVNSLKDQSIDNFLIIILVDGQIPALTMEYLSSIGSDSQIKVLNFKENRGLAYVLNDGIRYCIENGIKYIARMDADDICINTRMEHQLKFMEDNPNVDVVGGYIFEFSDDMKSGKLIKFPLTHKECFSFFKFRDPFAHPAVFFNQTYFRKAGLYDENTIGYKNWEDSWLWFNGFLNGCIFANIPEVVLKFRVNSDFFKVRRNGITRALAYAKDRYYINSHLKLGILSQLYLVPKFILNILPSSIKKYAYNILRN